MPTLTETPVATTVRTPRFRRSWSISVPWNGVTPWKRVTTHSSGSGASGATIACCGEPGASPMPRFAVAARSRQFAAAPAPSRRRAIVQWKTGAPAARAAARTRAIRAIVPCRATASASAPSFPASPTTPSWHSMTRSAARRPSRRLVSSTGTGSADRVEPAWVLREHRALRALGEVRPLRDDLHGVRELAVPVVVVRGVEEDAVAELARHVRDAALVGIRADEAAAGEEVLARLPVDRGRLLRRELPMLVETLEP